ncbi:BglG family transcription antiterminator [Paenibacillus sp. 1001270B_150601_E10]|uniref:BglG family transcription antiterminator n=1 Tax=Paenibacillus sp. 1001270B_150601_E10 TaxID=2787079 RepID=UPI0018A0053D|nr:helix-turn-helix domain-containing protein [Paenibacillus sp. 1001270B_150601_E10]
MKILERQIQLLHTLIESSTWMKTDELAEMLSCSPKTVQHDLKVLAGCLSDGWSVVTNRGKGVMLKRSSEENILMMVQRIERMGGMSQLIQLLIQLESGCSLQTISDSLYYSVSKVSKLLRELEVILKDYQLKLKKKPIKIEGDELHYRQFLFDFCQSGYDGTWPFKTDKEAIMELISKVEEAYGFKYFEEAYLQIATMFGVWSERVSRRKTLTRFHYPQLLEKIEISAKPALELLKPYVEQRCIHCSEAEMNYLASVLLGARRTVEDEERLYQYIVSRCERVQQYVVCILEEMDKRLSSNLAHDATMIRDSMIYVYFSIVRWITGVHCFYYPYKTFIEKSYPDIFAAIEEAIEHCVDRDIELRKDDIADLVMYAIACNVETQIREPKTFLLFSPDQGAARYMQKKLKMIFDKELNIIPCVNYKDVHEKAKKKKIDGVLTTSMSHFHEHLSMPFIQISPLLTDRDIQSIRQELLIS